MFMCMHMDGCGVWLLILLDDLHTMGMGFFY